MTNRFEHLVGATLTLTHFTRMRRALLHLADIATEGNLITPEERKTLEDIVIGFVIRETELRIEHGRYVSETLSLVQEQLIELSEAEVQALRDALRMGHHEATSDLLPRYNEMLDQFRDPLPRVFLKFDTPERRAERQAQQVRQVLDADRLKPGPWTEVSTPPEARTAVENAAVEARAKLLEHVHQWGSGSPLMPPEIEQGYLQELITSAAYLWACLRFKA